MANRKLRMCRLCLSTSAILRSIFTIFRNHNLVFIIRDYVRLEIKENDNLPQMVCKSCAVKLIRVRENVSLFVDSDRKLRRQLGGGDSLAGEELGQSRKRKYTRKQGEVAGSEVGTEKRVIKTEVGSTDVDSDGRLEASDLKQEVLSSDSEEDLPLKVLQSFANKTESDGPMVCDISPDVIGKREFVKEGSVGSFDHAISPTPVNSDGQSEDEGYKPEKVFSAINTERPKRSKRQTRAMKFEATSDMDTDDEERDITFKVEEPESKDCDVESNNSSVDSPGNVGKPTGKRRGRPKKAFKEPKKAVNKRPRKAAPKKPTSPVPTLHDFKCYICKSESLGSRQALIEHFASHVDRVPHTCTECVMETVVLTRVRTLNTHMKMHAQPVKCDYCDRRYSNAAGKYYHTQTFHLGGGAPCLVNCEVCGKTCGSQSALKQHMKYHTTKLKCSKCDMEFNHPNKRRNHERTHDENGGFQCVMCKKMLQSIESYDVHLKKHSQERSYQCHLCPKKFNTSCNLILHLKVHAKNDNYKPAKSWVEHYTILSREPMHYKCNHCDRYNTDKVNNMISHLQAHFKEYECDQCHHKFATAKQLRAHYTTHTGEKPEKCKYCDKVFSTKNNLRIHLRASHPEWTPRGQQQQQAGGVEGPSQSSALVAEQFDGDSPNAGSSSFAGVINVVVPAVTSTVGAVQSQNVLGS